MVDTNTIFTEDDEVRADGVKIHKGNDGLFYYSQPNNNRLDYVVDLSNGVNNKGATYYNYNSDGTIRSTMTIDRDTYMDLASRGERPIRGRTAGKSMLFYYDKTGELDHVAHYVKEDGKNLSCVGTTFHYKRNDNTVYVGFLPGINSLGKKAEEVRYIFEDEINQNRSANIDVLVSENGQKFDARVDAHDKETQATTKTVTRAPVSRPVNTR